MSVTKSTIKVSLTQFAAYATKTPEQQLTVVRRVMRQHANGYIPREDIYRRFRDAVVFMHRNGKPKTYLDEVANEQTEPSRAKHYPVLAKGYKTFMGRKSMQWFDPPRGVWSCGDLRVNIRPEVGLVIDGVPTAIKLWLWEEVPSQKRNALNKRRAEIIAHLMAMTLPASQDEMMTTLLDVRKGRLYCRGKSDREQTLLIETQAQSFVDLYRRL